jgi:DNA-binding transcriptional MerR regulator
VAAIVQAKAAGMSLDDIRATLTAATPDGRNKVLRHQHDELSRRVAEGQAALALIDTALGCEHGDLASCPRFRAVLAERVRHP